jgi:hypothetical protein
MSSASDKAAQEFTITWRANHRSLFEPPYFAHRRGLIHTTKITAASAVSAFREFRRTHLNSPVLDVVDSKGRSHVLDLRHCFDSEKAAQEFVANLNRNVLIDQLNDPVSNWLRKNGHEITRESWIEANYLGGKIPDPWTAEHEDELPEVLQRWPLTPPISK